jgi:hypothetical protein
VDLLDEGLGGGLELDRESADGQPEKLA